MNKINNRKIFRSSRLTCLALAVVRLQWRTSKDPSPKPLALWSQRIWSGILERSSESAVLVACRQIRNLRTSFWRIYIILHSITLQLLVFNQPCFWLLFSFDFDACIIRSHYSLLEICLDSFTIKIIISSKFSSFWRLYFHYSELK